MNGFVVYYPSDIFIDKVISFANKHRIPCERRCALIGKRYMRIGTVSGYGYESISGKMTPYPIDPSYSMSAPMELVAQAFEVTRRDEKRKFVEIVIDGEKYSGFLSKE